MFFKRITLLTFLFMSISFSQLKPGQISLAGWGETEDQAGDENGIYEKYIDTKITSTVSYNLNYQISIDAKFNMRNYDIKRYDDIENSNLSRDFLIGPTYFLKNNFYLSYLFGKSLSEGQDSYWTPAIPATGYWDGDWNGYTWTEFWVETSPEVEASIQTYSYKNDRVISNVVLGYRLYLSSSASLDIGYNLYLYQGADSSSEIEFLLRMFL